MHCYASAIGFNSCTQYLNSAVLEKIIAKIPANANYVSALFSRMLARNVNFKRSPRCYR